MRLGVISDIHGNAVALDAVLTDIDRDPPDRLICLGDAIQGGPQPREVVERLRDRRIPTVLGNADAFLLSGEFTARTPPPAERMRVLDEVRAWSLTRLTEADRAFIAAFDPTLELALDSGRTLLAFHGTPASYDDIILPDTPEDEFRRYLGDTSAQVRTGGHTHVPFLRRLGDGFFFNPGSVGQAYDHHPEGGVIRPDAWAEYAVLTSRGDDLSLEFRRVGFDRAALIDVYATSGRPHADQAIAEYSGT